MEKKSKVTNVTGNGTYEGKYGMLYKYEVSFENGDTGNYLSKTENQNRFIVGQEVDYIYEQKEYNGKVYYNVKPNNMMNQGGYKKDPKTDERITRMSVLKVAGDLVIANKIKIEEMTSIALMLEEFVKSGSDTMRSAMRETDQLPF